MKVVAIIQARMGSTRLPGKVMMNLGGHPVLQWCIRAAKAAPGIDEVWVATTRLPADDVIYETYRHAGPVYRGSETDVLARFMNCTVEAGATNGGDIILRLTGDCPFLDPQVIGQVVRLMKQTPGCHYASNTSPRTYPDGLDVQAMTRSALSFAYHEATRPIDRDCVTTWIERNRSRFPAEALINPIPGMERERWVLDTEDDLHFCRAIARSWPWQFGPPSQLNILNILDFQPALRDLNSSGVMNERYFEALAEEPIYQRTFERSQEALTRAEKVIPLGAQTFSKSFLQYPQPSPLFLSHGQGALAWDIDGNEYVDLVSALLPTILGVRDPDVDAAIRRQLCSGISFSLATELEAELAETLCRLIPCAEAVRFGKTGTDVTTAAIRAARAFTGRDRVLICGGYHGWADWSVERNLGVPLEVRQLVTRVKPIVGFDRPVNLSEIAACIVEPEGNPEFLQWLRDMCYEAGIVLIFDEVITGFRFDLGGAQKLFGVTPDLACFGKAMANGMPLSAVVGRRDIMAKFAPPDNIFYSGTFFGETLSLAAGIATIKKLESDNIIPQLWNVGGLLADEAQKLVEAHEMQTMITQSRGNWPAMQLKFRDDQLAALFRREMINSGTLIINRHNITAAHGPNEIRRILKSYDHALGYVAEAIMADEVEERLAGASITQGVRA